MPTVLYRLTGASILASALTMLMSTAAFTQELRVQTQDATASIGEPQIRPGAASEANPEIATLRAAAEAYRRGDIAGGDTIARTLTQIPVSLAAEWIAIRLSNRSLGFERLHQFIIRNPDLPMRKWLLRRAEEALMIERARPAKTLAFFDSRMPETPAGRAILASAKASGNDHAAAHRLALDAYRDKTITRDIAEYLEKTFPDLITPDEQALRAHRLILNNQRGEGLRLASKLGADHLKLAEALALASNKGTSLQPLEAVAPALRQHSSYKLARAQILRRQDKLAEARDTINSASHNADLLADADEWWTERRVLARRLLDAGDPGGAFRIVAEHSAKSIGRQAEAEFHAGWIALRYLHYPQSALMHFDRSAAIAELVAAKSRAAYWRGRAFEAGALGDEDAGSAAYQAASLYPATYYGQLAAAKIGKEALTLPATEASQVDESLFLASPAGQLIQVLFEAGLKDLALPVAMDFARTAQSPSQIDAAVRRFVAQGDAPAVLALGRMATARGLPLEQHAFPTFGIPSYQPLSGSAEKAMVYAIARQESAFHTKAVSHANARGLMQMLPSTASRTAQRFKVAFDSQRLIADPAFNAMLGAAHLGELMEETKGSLVMTFASYNAGGHRVREWIETAGDPRKPGVDVIDWVERIPFYETRNYVQRIMENLQVYRARMQGNQSVLLIGRDMETGRRR
ncbi:MAG: lytic transglycosylase domain-containing protein [Beijerinckiaceae bacterium]